MKSDIWSREKAASQITFPLLTLKRASDEQRSERSDMGYKCESQLWISIWPVTVYLLVPFILTQAIR